MAHLVLCSLLALAPFGVNAETLVWHAPDKERKWILKGFIVRKDHKLYRMVPAVRGQIEYRIPIDEGCYSVAAVSQAASEAKVDGKLYESNEIRACLRRKK